MLTDIEKTVALCNCREKLKETAKTLMDRADYNKFRRMLDELYSLMMEAYVATLSSVESLQVEKRALSPKLDPAIMGGLVDGIAGPGAGIYTAMNVAERNAEIDELRKDASSNARQATSNAQSARTRMIHKHQEVLTYIKKYSQLERIYQEALSSHETQNQVKQEETDTIKIASWIFTAIIVVIVALVVL